MLNQKNIYLFAGVIIFSLLLSLYAKPKYIGVFSPINYLYILPDSTEKKQDELELKYPIHDRQGDHVTDKEDNPFNIENSDAVKKQVEYDPETNTYIITEKVGDRDIKPPIYMTFEEYRAYEKKETLKDYWEERSNSLSLVENKNAIPTLVQENKGFEKTFGGLSVDIKPSGNVDLTLGGNFQKIDNPILSQRQRRQGGFDFNMNININVVGNIGDLVKLNFNYNTQATFDFENQIKLNYQGKEDQILKNIEAGNVSFPLTTSLIRGSQSLFGIKTQLQFGRLRITTVLSQQRSRSENLQIQNGSQVQRFEIMSDQYDENRHFFLNQAFRDQYNAALSTMPNITSLINITRIEVWVTNRTGVFQNVREVVGFSDLAEPVKIHRADIVQANPNFPRPDNRSNNLWSVIDNDQQVRSSNAEIRLSQLGYRQVEDFEKAFSRRLNANEFTVNSQLGYISLNQQLFPDEILCVAYEYTFNGQIFKVGEFAQDASQDFNIATGTIDTLQRKPLLLKMLKSTANRPTLPIWDLMMKNIYSLGAFQLSQEDFRLDVFYQDPGGGLKRFIPEGAPKGRQLIRVLNMDNLNVQRDPQPDGIFDFFPGVTINPTNGRLIFPVLEPFGSDLEKEFDPGEEQIAEKFIYRELYDSTKFIAQQFPEKNRYVIKGSYRSGSSSEISLGAFNIPQGSVTVTAGGAQLAENIDYTIDYSLGRIRILNEGILNAGTPINVAFENNALFGFQQKTFIGNRLDYRVNDKLNLGGTILNMKERPFTQKVNLGDDPIANTIYGLDFNYNTQSQFLTYLVDKLPLYKTKQISSFAASGEIAYLKPGVNQAIGADGGFVYIDDFEGTSNSSDLRFPANAWIMASTPQGALDRRGNVLFPEAELANDLTYGMNRAKLAWYNIDPLFLRNNSQTPSHIASNRDMRSSHYVRELFQTELFPNRTNLQPGVVNNIITLDLAYYPNERGQYNFENKLNGEPGFSSGLNPDGTLKSPRSRWGGIMRAFDNNDFENSNVEFIEFWLLDPFIENQDNSGELYINLGNISEDILKDSKYFFENGLTGPDGNVTFEETEWGKVPTQQNIVNAFDNDPSIRQFQDVGLDGLNDSEESLKFAAILANLQNVLNPDALQKLQTDPASDNFLYYLNDFYDQNETPILGRYKNFNNQQGNSPASNGGAFAQAQTNTPDSEDLNRDFTVNKSEQYFQYRIPLAPQEMQIGRNNIVDKKDATVRLPNGNTETISWFQFKIPVREFDNAIGGISDFRSIRFIRMFLTGFEDSIILRFARLDLVRNQWRRYFFTLQEPGEFIPQDFEDNTFFNVIAVNIEENANRTPIPYVLPDGIRREQNLSAQNINALQNEQSLSLQVCNLLDGDARAVTKPLNMDMRFYDRLKMFIHLESRPGEIPLKDGDVRAFIRLGQDFTQNFYEYEIPLTVTPDGTTDPKIIWSELNEVDLKIDSLIELKLARNDAGSPINSPFSIIDGKGNKFTIMGNPDLSLVEVAMLGIRNPKATGNENDDGLPKCAEIWFNEMRLNGVENKGAMAAMGRMEAQLADLGSLVFSTNMHKRGFGQVDQKVGQRMRDDFFQYDLAGNFEMGKFLPEKTGIRIPLFLSISRSFSTPQFDPYLFDVPVSEISKRLDGKEKSDYKKTVQDRSTIKSINFTNVRKVRTNNTRQPRFYDVENLNFTYAYSVTKTTNPIIEFDKLQRHKATVGYNHAPKVKSIAPFEKLVKSKNKNYNIIKDINFNFMPSSLSFTSDWNRQFGEQKLRNLDPTDEIIIESTFFKTFTWDRFYGIQYSPFKSLTLDFNAVNNARIDEPPGKLDTKEEKDSLWTNFWNLGRNTRYTHSLDANYTLPINKIPVLDWVQVRAGYTTSYTWTAAPLFINANDEIIANPLGNTVANTRDRRLNGEFNIRNLYNKVGFLKQYNGSSRNNQTKADREKTKENNRKRIERIESDKDKQKEDLQKIKQEIKTLKAEKPRPEDYKIQLKTLRQRKRTQRERLKKLDSDKARITNPENPAVAALVKPLIGLKRVSVNYTNSQSTQLPGWVPGTTLLGLDSDFDFNAPGFGFVFGSQPNQAWLDRAAEKGFFTPDTNMNFQLMQNKQINWNVRGTIEPFRDLRVDLTVNKTTTNQFTEFFKKQSPNGEFVHLNPINSGTWSISFISFKTIFQKANNQGLTAAFVQFNNNRALISQRLSEQNPNSGLLPFVAPVGDDSTEINGFFKGFGPFSQDVLIPSFLAAYQKKSTDDVKLNPFKNIPLPNWRLTYTGLNKFKSLKKIFSNITLTHAYNSTFSINNFQSNLSFQGESMLQPSNIDTATGNFFSKFAISSVVITEQFAPLIGIDMTFTNNILARFDYRQTRNLSFGFLDNQLSESRTTEVTVGLGYRVTGLSLPFKVKGQKKKLKNEVNMRVDVAVRDNVTINQRLDQAISQPTNGMKSIRISPSIDYIINNRMNIRFFLDRTRTIPAISSSFPITNTQGGVTLRFTLVP